MKTILTPTDLSEISNNAIEYAIEFAKLMDAKIILLHIFNLPVITTDVIVITPTIDEMEEYAIENLNKLKQNILLKHAGLNIECKARIGNTVDEINLFAKENKVDIIIMGMQGSGYIKEKLIGSVTTSLLRKSQCPVLSIEKKAKFKAIKKIVLACEYSDTENKILLTPLKEISRLFKSHVYILNVINEFSFVPSDQDATSSFVSIENSLSDIDHSLHYLKAENVVDGINSFITEKSIDMVVMIPHKHSILTNIFQGSNTKQMAFHTSIPLMAIHE